ncbi:MAG: hypothetical protein KIT76_08080 [Pseudolabrys sp.]|nr:hypothetical protein [Pseudolabrys sp.]MCW5697657.1 hypothetical protein [Bauldia sp.]
MAYRVAGAGEPADYPSYSDASRRTLARLLVAGGGLWLLAEIGLLPRGSGFGMALAALGFGLVAVGVWVVFAAWQTRFSAIGSSLAFVGAAAIALVTVSRLGSGGVAAGGLGIEMLAILVLGLGLVILGVSVFLSRDIPAPVGTVLIAATVLWTIVAALDAASVAQRLAGAAVALSLIVLAVASLQRAGANLPFLAALGERLAALAARAPRPRLPSLAVPKLSLPGRRHAEEPAAIPTANDDDALDPELSESTGPVTAEQRNTIGLALALAAGGLLLFLLDVFDIASTGAFWPLALLVPGVLLVVAALRRDFVETAPVVGGAVLATTGLIFLGQQATGDYGSWAYAWALYPLVIGLALGLVGIRNGDERLTGIGRNAAVGGLAVVLVAGIVFDRLVGRGGEGGAYLLPLALIGAGVAILWLTVPRPQIRPAVLVHTPPAVLPVAPLVSDIRDHAAPRTKRAPAKRTPKTPTPPAAEKPPAPRKRRTPAPKPSVPAAAKAAAPAARVTATASAPAAVRPVATPKASPRTVVGAKKAAPKRRARTTPAAAPNGARAPEAV